MKKILAILVIFTTCTGICACSNETPNNATLHTETTSVSQTETPTVTNNTVVTEMTETTGETSITPTDPPSVKPTEHIHQYTKIVTQPTCTDKGYSTYTCSCGDTYKSSETAATGHAWTSWKTTKEPTYREEGDAVRICEICEKTESKTLEKIKLTESTGLYFEPICGNSKYSLKKVGTCTDKDIVIPAEYNGKPVTQIDAGAFRECSNITSVVIPNNIVSIGDCAFYNCTNLTSIVIPSSVTVIYMYAFENCSNLTTIQYEGTIAQWKTMERYPDWFLRYEGEPCVIYCTDGNLQR